MSDLVEGVAPFRLGRVHLDLASQRALPQLQQAVALAQVLPQVQANQLQVPLL